MKVIFVITSLFLSYAAAARPMTLETCSDHAEAAARAVMTINQIFPSKVTHGKSAVTTDGMQIDFFAWNADSETPLTEYRVIVDQAQCQVKSVAVVY